MTGFWVLGAGGHGRVVAELIEASGQTVLGFVDRYPDRAAHGTASGGLGPRIEAEEPFLARWREAGADPDEVLALGLGDNVQRFRHFRALRGGNPGAEEPGDADLAWRRFPILVHPTAWISPSAELGAGTVVLPRALVHTGARVGEAVIVNSGALIEHDVELGDGAHVAPGAVVCGGALIGPGAWVGAGAVVLPGRSVGAGSVVGAGAVVVHDLPAGETGVGVPARRHRPTLSSTFET
jgi:sugar O-acyltransferase (sialic acid O-acetyltransferase NeuD family)